jgi:hypothetical protein
MLSFTSTRAFVGADAQDGKPGSDARSNGQTGSTGTAGAPAADLGSRFGNRAWTGSDAADLFTISHHVTAGDGGDGGAGGDGRDNRTIQSSFGTAVGIVVTYGSAGDGAAGAPGGAGGAAWAKLEQLDLLLRGTPAVIGGDTIALEVAATGGHGGRGGAPGIGGNAIDSTTLVIAGGLVDTFIGGVGGSIGDAGAGADGGRAFAVLRDIRIEGDALISVGATATGGNGGAGANAASGGAVWGGGRVGGAAGDGGDGGDGGKAGAALDGFFLDAGAPTTLVVSLVAVGGHGGSGGQATRLGATGRETIARADVVAVELTPGPAAAGGDGGAGGDAVARLTDSRIALGDGPDLVSLLFQAVGGRAGEGDQGTEAEFPGRGSERVWNGSDGYFDLVRTFYGRSAGPDGTDGAHGASLVRIINNDIALGGGDDRLQITLATDGTGGPEMTRVRGNIFDGGPGTDVFSFWGDVGVALNVARGWIAAGSGPRNTLSGFEHFEFLGRMQDTITDGAGNQIYDGGGGADRFLFGRGHGRDVVTAAFDDGAVIVLRGFGSGLDSFTEILARSVSIEGGTRIVTEGTSSIDLLGVSRTALRADMFEFA